MGTSNGPINVTVSTELTRAKDEIERLKGLIKEAQWKSDPSKAAGFHSLRKFCEVDGLNFETACSKAREAFLVQLERADEAEAQALVLQERIDVALNVLPGVRNPSSDLQRLVNIARALLKDDEATEPKPQTDEERTAAAKE